MLCIFLLLIVMAIFEQGDYSEKPDPLDKINHDSSV